MGLAELARHAGELADSLGRIAGAESARRGQPVSCARGCAACCREVVPLSAGEALLLANSIAASDPERRLGIEAGFLRATVALRTAGLDTAPLLDRAADYFALSLPCPFLSGEECSVHASRPLACRGHLVSSPPSSCLGFPDSSIAVVAPPVPVGEVLSEVTGARLGGTEMIPLPRMPEWLAGAGELAESTWDGAEILDRLAEACLARLG